MGRYVEVTRIVSFEAAHRLMTHPGACRNIHGHSYRVEVTLSGLQQSDGRLVDFADLDAAVKEITHSDKETCWDHALLVNGDDPLLAMYDMLAEAGMRVRVLDWEPTAENMAMHIQDRLTSKFQSCAVVVKVWETANSYATAPGRIFVGAP